MGGREGGRPRSHLRRALRGGNAPGPDRSSVNEKPDQPHREDSEDGACDAAPVSLRLAPGTSEADPEKRHRDYDRDDAHPGEIAQRRDSEEERIAEEPRDEDREPDPDQGIPVALHGGSSRGGA